MKNGLTGLRPKFTGNQALTDQPGADGKLGRGGAGGAIFVQSDSTAYLTGGTFEDNLSGYLGGAIYTEEKSTTYVGKSVAYGNTAGHFGGGLWFCPSGNSTASKGGNIALYDNATNPAIDGNPDNDAAKIPPYFRADTMTQAGADLAIMNPYWKWVNGWMKGISTNQFQLLDTWFTNRSEQAVTWYWDNVPLQHSSGYHDSWQQTAETKRQGIEAVLATSKDPKNHTEQAPGLLQLQANDHEPGNQWIRTGLALKATVKNEGYKAEAWQKAQIRMTGNQARLSGGAFGSNGVVVFDSPYSMNWNKVDEQGKEVDTASTWELSTNKLTDPYTSPYLDEDMRPTDCQSGGAADGCWVKDAEGVWSVDIVDNGPRDNDPAFGGISLDNLAPGTYTLKEKTPPTGYQKTDKTYTFTIVAVESGGIPKPVELKDASGKTVTDSAIVNHPATGVLAWSKTDADNTRIAGSVWTITKLDNTTVDVADRTATDNLTSLDEDAGDGDFRISLFKDRKPDPAWPDGKYTLQEETAPTGYWKTGKTYSFTITTQDSGNRTATWDDKDVTTGRQFTNKPTIVSWSKVSADNTDQTLPGSEWTITKLDDGGQPTGSSRTVSDCRPGACSTPLGGLKDSDETAGKFTVKSLEPGSYQLEEKTAPEGYAKTDTKYTFTIGTTEGDVTIRVKNESSGEAVADNRIVNHAIVTALPFTGGRDTRDWYIIGGGIALLGLAAAVAYQRMRRNSLH
ncbi:hypothetical protein BW14_08505 [Bifidobacterium sp. UTBIF-68]|uniref:MSCRAMM family protein n=1 Tax=Bifidobacterium sp. UTBIF-68 TaxID=1465262 RepID=UPI00112DDFD5|nr:prealbumin-like fold domain-containing protein [Bifidobacterium sp. UTBIF-68]TPF92570.1 hypothetical protein BW14_08505 [Bifidobacterium sp. UTBIF-68]